MKDELISREAAMNCCFKPQVRPNAEIFNALKMAIRSEISAVPSVSAVPLEPLCKFLAGYAVPPIRSPLATYGNLEEAWKAYLLKWMEKMDNGY